MPTARPSSAATTKRVWKQHADRREQRRHDDLAGTLAIELRLAAVLAHRAQRRPGARS
jgi:hypothetical protein